MMLNTGKSDPMKKVTKESQELRGGMNVVENLYIHHDTPICHAIKPSVLGSTQDDISIESVQLVFKDDKPELGAGIEK